LRHENFDPRLLADRLPWNAFGITHSMFAGRALPAFTTHQFFKSTASTKKSGFPSETGAPVIAKLGAT